MATDFLDVIAHLQALLLNVSSIVTHSKEIVVVRHILVVVVSDFLLRVLLVDLSHKFACYRLSTPCFSFNTCLNDLYFQPIWVSSPLSEFFNKVIVPENLDLIPIIIPNKGRIFIPVRFILLLSVFDDLRQLLPHGLKIAKISLVVVRFQFSFFVS